MFKIAAYKHIDCENVVVCNRAEWDGNQPRLPGFSLSPTTAPWDEEAGGPTLGTGLEWELDGF